MLAGKSALPIVKQVTICSEGLTQPLPRGVDYDQPTMLRSHNAIDGEDEAAAADPSGYSAS